MKRILFNDFFAEPDYLKNEQLLAVKDVIDSGTYILGNQVSLFEKAWGNKVNSNYVVGVGNAFDGLVLGLQALNIGPGDEVITTPMTAYATTLAILRVGAIPVICDIDLETAHLSLESADRLVGKHTKALLYVHLYGRAGNLEKIKKFCEERKILFIEDCAQAHGAKHNGVSVGSVGDFGAWSYYPTKNLGAIGDAGAISTNNKDLAEKISILRNYGQTVRYYHDYIGINSRLDEIQAAILNVRLKYLNDFTDKRRYIAGKYNKLINSDLVEKMKFECEAEQHVYHLYVLRSRDRDRVMRFLEEKKIPTLIHYPVLTNLQNASLGKVKYESGGLINAIKHSKECFSIPCHPQMNDEMTDYIISTINEYK